MTRASLSWIFSLALLLARAAFAQNVVEDRDHHRTLPPISISLKEAAECIDRAPGFSGTPRSKEAVRVARKLDQHVAEFLAGAPWMPFHHTLGISGYEAYYDHPDELFYTLSIAVPFLAPEAAARAKRFLLEMLGQSPPYALDGFDRRDGKPRESYQVPLDLRFSGRGQAKSAFGVYAFWTFCHYAGAPEEASNRWSAVKARVEPLLQQEYRFDIERMDYSGDEAEKLNGDLAGLIGFTRLARANSDTEAQARGQEAVRDLLELRVNLERVNPKILDRTSATKNLHLSKLARYCSLTPEIADALRRWSGGLASERLRAFRSSRSAWHLAFGDRMVGGENYTNPLNFPRALFAGAAFIEGVDAPELTSLVDVPWCAADLYFIEKCAYALWATAGCPWQNSR